MIPLSKQKEEKAMVNKVIVKVLESVGKTMAKVDVNTSCPWIHYQPKAPKSVESMRDKKCRFIHKNCCFMQNLLK